MLAYCETTYAGLDCGVFFRNVIRTKKIASISQHHIQSIIILQATLMLVLPHRSPPQLLTFTTKATHTMARRLAPSTVPSTSLNPSTSSVPDASPKSTSPYRWDDAQHPMYSHPSFKTYGQAGIINGIIQSSPPSSTSYTPSTTPGTPAPLAVPPLENYQLPEEHTMVSVGGILTKIPSRMVKKKKPEVPTPNASTSIASSVPATSPKPQSPYRWDDTQHPMYSHPIFKPYRQTAIINDINPSTVHHVRSTILGTPTQINSQPEEAHTTISIGGILTKIPPRMAKKAEAEAQAPMPNL